MDGVYYIVVDHMQTLQKLQKLAIAEANTENVSAYAYENVLGINITGDVYKRQGMDSVSGLKKPMSVQPVVRQWESCLLYTSI